MIINRNILYKMWKNVIRKLNYLNYIANTRMKPPNNTFEVTSMKNEDSKKV